MADSSLSDLLVLLACVVGTEASRMCAMYRPALGECTSGVVLTFRLPLELLLPQIGCVSVDRRFLCHWVTYCVEDSMAG